MKTKKQEPKKLSEEKRYTFYGISIDVRIDYRKKRITLIDNDRNRKYWIFAEREVEFLDSWVQILEAMKLAIKEAKKDLQEYVDAENIEQVEFVMNVEKGITKLEKESKK